MRRLRALLGSAAFFVIAPGSVAGIVPGMLTGWRARDVSWAPPPVRAGGVVTGQALLLGRVNLLEHAAFLLAAFHAFVLGYDEPVLRATYGAEYGACSRAVRRWLPRFSAYRGEARRPEAGRV